MGCKGEIIRLQKGFDVRNKTRLKATTARRLDTIAAMSVPMLIMCPGQGAQTVGMAKAWLEASTEARAVFAHADRIAGTRFGTALSEICLGGPAELLNRTDVSQPAIYATSIACWHGLVAKLGMAPGDEPLAATAGLSLGEYTALCVAGVLSFEDGLKLVMLRGRAMQDAAESPEAASGGGGGMIALIGADEAQAQQVCDEARAGDILVCANFNTPGQVVLSGHNSACARAAEVAARMGLRSAILPVSGAFHSPLMQSAAVRLGEALAKTSMHAGRCIVMSNVSAEPHESGSGAAESIRMRLSEQLIHPVKWAQCCSWLANNVKGDWHELAPQRTLAGMMRRIDKGVKVIGHDEA